MREALENVQGKILGIAGECMEEKKEEIIGLLVYQQFDEGVDSEGNPLRQYSPSYKREKQQLTGRGDKTDLNLTGEFQQTLNLTVQGDTYYFDSPATTDTGELKSDWLNKWNRGEGKTKSLFAGNSGNIMMLTPDNQARIWPIIKDVFIERVNEEVALD